MEHVIVTSAVSESLEAAWNACLDSADFAAHYTAPEFFREKYFDGRWPFAVLAVHDDVIHGVATGCLDRRDINCGAPGSPHVCVRGGADLDKVGRALAAG